MHGQFVQAYGQFLEKQLRVCSHKYMGIGISSIDYPFSKYYGTSFNYSRMNSEGYGVE
jgi:hypothetical protein